MSFTFVTSIPAAGNNPSIDQPTMLANNVAIDGIIAVDHVSFNSLGGGEHEQITFNNKNVPGAQTDPKSTLYTNSGTASSVSKVFYRNQNATFQAMPIVAWGTFAPLGISLTQSSNVTNIVRNAAGNYTVTLANNVCIGTNYGVLISAAMTPFSVGGITGYSITSATQFNIYTRALTGSFGTDTGIITFAVLQI